MKIEVNVRKEYVYLIAGLLIILIGVVIINAAVDKTKAWHSASQVEINIPNIGTKSVQEAWNQRFDSLTNNDVQRGFTIEQMCDALNSGNPWGGVWLSAACDDFCRIKKNTIGGVGVQLDCGNNLMSCLCV